MISEERPVLLRNIRETVESIFFPLSDMHRRMSREVLMYVVIDEPNTESQEDSMLVLNLARSIYGRSISVSEYFHDPRSAGGSSGNRQKIREWISRQRWSQKKFPGKKCRQGEILRRSRQRRISQCRMTLTGKMQEKNLMEIRLMKRETMEMVPMRVEYMRMAPGGMEEGY